MRIIIKWLPQAITLLDNIYRFYSEKSQTAAIRLYNSQHDNGMIPAYKDVEWTCSTGMFQLAITWYKLGELEKGNKTFEYAMHSSKVRMANSSLMPLM